MIEIAGMAPERPRTGHSPLDLASASRAAERQCGTNRSDDEQDDQLSHAHVRVEGSAHEVPTVEQHARLVDKWEALEGVIIKLDCRLDRGYFYKGRDGVYDDAGHSDKADGGPSAPSEPLESSHDLDQAECEAGKCR